MIVNRHRVLVALAAAPAVVPTAAVPGVPWWVVATSAAAAFLGTLAKLEEVIAPTVKPAAPSGEPQ